MKQQNIKLARRNLRLVMLESAITAGLLSMSIMTPFFKSIGLNQAQISLTQAIFTAVALILNFPAGWLADRLSRKMANLIGDFGVFLTFLCYSQVQGFMGAVACECTLGFFLALSQGVDMALLKHFSGQLAKNPSLELEGEKLFFDYSARLASRRYLATAITVLLGGPIGAISFRLTIALSGVPYLIGGIASCFIVDDSPRLEPVYQNPFKDMGRIIKTTIKNRPLSLRILAYASGREMTHAIIWVFTPMLLYAGVPLKIVSVAWVINSVSCLIGARLARKYAAKLPDYQKVALPVVVMGISMLILSVKINLFTIGFYWLTGIVQGWTGAVHMLLVQEHVSDQEQTAVVSLAHVFGQIIYTPITLITGICADISLRLVPFITLVIFIPLGTYIAVQMYIDQLYQDESQQ